MNKKRLCGAKKRYVQYEKSKRATWMLPFKYNCTVLLMFDQIPKMRNISEIVRADNSVETKAIPAPARQSSPTSLGNTTEFIPQGSE